MAIHSFTDFIPEGYYQSDSFSLEGATSQDGLVAEFDSVEVYRESHYVHGRSSSFTTDLTAAITAYRVANGAGSEIIDDGRVDRRLSYDSSGNLYTLVTVDNSGTTENFMCLSTDDGVTWEAFILPGNRKWVRIEFNEHSTRRPDTPPVVLQFNDSGLLEVVIPVLSMGDLDFSSVVTITSTLSLLWPQHSGAGNSAITVGADTILVAWPSNESTGGVGTKQYVSVVSRSGESVTSTTLIGTSNTAGGPDEHDAPAIAVDSSDVCHGILGAHHGDLDYTYASSPYTSWASVETVAEKQVGGGGHTYMALVCDSNDDLYVASRNADAGYRFKISLYKRTSGTWAFVDHLVYPGRTFYAIYYHSLSILEDDTLVFTSPGHLPAQLSASEYTIYNGLFPGEVANTPDGSGRIQYQSTQKAHFPMVFTSSNGTSWTKTNLSFSAGSVSDAHIPYLALRGRITPRVTFRCANAATGLVSSTGADDTATLGSGHAYEQTSIHPLLYGTSLAVKNGTTSGSGFYDSAATTNTQADVIHSIEMWFKLTAQFSSSGAGQDHFLISRHSASTATGNYALTVEYVSTTTAKIGAYWNDGTNGNKSSITTGTLLALNTTYHLIATYATGASGILLYLNGLNYATTDGTTAMVGSALNRFTIGCSTSGTRAAAEAIFQEVSLYDKVITPFEALSLNRGYAIQTPVYTRGRNLFTLSPQRLRRA